jgi:hypothetical protein
MKREPLRTSTRKNLTLAFGCALALVNGCGKSPTSPTAPTPPPRTELTYSRPAAELIGPESGTYTRLTATFEGRTGTVGGFSDPYLGINVRAVDGRRCSLNLAAPRGFTLQVGTYSRATRWPFQSPNAPGMDFTCLFGCNTSEGSFVIRELAIDAAGVLQRIDVSFEQRCTHQTFASALMTGTLRVYPDS